MITRNTAAGALRTDLGSDGRERLAKAALGLTLFEAENAFARAMVDDGRLTDSDIVLVQDEKKQIVQKSGVLEVVSSSIGLDDIGGLENLKTWLRKRNGSWMDEARAYGLPAPKGVLVTGVPGCGKSMTAKAMASAWSLPLVRLDIGKVFGGLVGASEQNMRTALRTAEAIAPCVMWIDEIEKGFASGASGSGDSGTSARVFGTFLSWMQEKTAAVFVIATANTISLLPPDSVVVLCTGSQGEPLSALARIAAHDHPAVEIQKGDTVIISARPVPGNETSVYRTIDRLFAAGARVIYESTAGVHVSGHASCEELNVMLNLVRPKYFMPVHGEHRHLFFHAELARQIGIPDENIFLLENGDVLELTPDSAEITGKVQAGMILVDGFAMGDFHDLVLRDRQHLASDGLVMVVVARSSQDGSIVGEPEVVLRGIAHAGGLDELADEAKRLVTSCLTTEEMRQVTDATLLKNHVHDALQKFLRKEAGRRPMILPVIVEV